MYSSSCVQEKVMFMRIINLQIKFNFLFGIQVLFFQKKILNQSLEPVVVILTLCRVSQAHRQKIIAFNTEVRNFFHLLVCLSVCLSVSDDVIRAPMTMHSSDNPYERRAAGSMLSRLKGLHVGFEKSVYEHENIFVYSETY